MNNEDLFQRSANFFDAARNKILLLETNVQLVHSNIQIGMFRHFAMQVS